VTTNKTVRLKDGTEVLIRPFTKEDTEESLAFFLELSERDKCCLRRDVDKLEVVEERIHEMEEGTVKRLVALASNRIVADGALELASYGWEKHVGELRLIVANPYQRKGLGVHMARELYDLAASAGLEELTVKMCSTQASARNIFRKLGFHDEVVLHGYVRDCMGAKQDLVIMRCKLADLWVQMEEFMYESDMHAFKMD